MLQGILQGNENWLPIGQHDGVAWLSRRLLETGHSGITVTHRLGSERCPARNHACALFVDLSASQSSLREIQGSKGDLFSPSTSILVRGGQTANYLLHLKVK